VREHAERRLVFSDASRSEPFDLIIDALGTRSPLAPPCARDLAYGALWATLDWADGDAFDQDALQQRYRRSSLMAGVLPIGRGQSEHLKLAFFWSLRCDRVDAWRAAGLDTWKAEVRGLWPDCGPLLDQIECAGQLTFARYTHRTLSAPVEPALVHIGDAWHSASPQLGQGANMALLDAWALALALEEADSVASALERAVAMRRGHVRLYQALTALFTPVYQSDSRVLPVLRDMLVGPMSKLWPATWIQAAMVSGLIGNPLRRCELPERP
jgi:2-polyprenyl-6-methoxyphenol hydroxylase-like FAD-dependent oxidoreductase